MKLFISAIVISTMVATTSLVSAQTEYNIGFDPEEVVLTEMGAFPTDAYADMGISSITCENVGPNNYFDLPLLPSAPSKGHRIKEKSLMLTRSSTSSAVQRISKALPFGHKLLEFNTTST